MAIGIDGAAHGATPSEAAAVGPGLPGVQAAASLTWARESLFLTGPACKLWLLSAGAHLQQACHVF